MQVQMPRFTPRYFPFVGGLDTAGQRSMVPPGMVQASSNYEADVQGGYRRIGGFERYDGRPRPSDSTYSALNLTTTPNPLLVVGVAVNGQTSGATGVVAYVGPTWVAVTKAGGFAAGENLRVGGTVVGVLSAATVSITPDIDNQILASCATIYRADISAPTGSGATQIMALDGVIYALRSNGTNMLIWKATATGWQSVPFMRELSFTAGTAEYAEGSTITRGAVSATVRRVILTSGTWGSNAAGRLIVSGVTGGEFTAGVSAGGGACTLAGPSSAISLLPGGELVTKVATFVNNQERVYGCDGVNRAFEFDGTVFAPIDIPHPLKPHDVEASGDVLYWACGPEVITSVTGEPFVYDAVRGSAQLGAGSRVTDLMTITGGSDSAILVGTKNGPRVLYGSDKDTWRMVTLGSDSEVLPKSAQPLQGGLFMDNSGIRTLASTQSWGNFSYGLASQRITSFVRGRRPSASSVIPSKTMYRLFFEDGGGMSGVPGPKGLQWMPINYGMTVRQMFTHEVGGVDRTFFVSDNGMVYEADVGRSFDGEEIEAYMMMHGFNDGSVGLLKTWRAGHLEAIGESAFSIDTYAEFDEGRSITERETAVTDGDPAGLRFDLGTWNSQVWDGTAQASLKLGIRGVGFSISVAFMSQSAIELPHTLLGLQFVMSQRRLRR